MEAEDVDVNEAEELSTKVEEKAERETMETEGVDVNEDVFQLEAEELFTSVEEKAEREAMEVEGVDEDEDVFQLEADESSTKVEEKAEPSENSSGTDMKMIMAGLSKLSSQMSQMASELWSKLDALLERNNVEYCKVDTDEDEVHQTDEKEIADTAADQSDFIKEMLEETD